MNEPTYREMARDIDHTLGWMTLGLGVAGIALVGVSPIDALRGSWVGFVLHLWLGVTLLLASLKTNARRRKYRSVRDAGETR